MINFQFNDLKVLTITDGESSSSCMVVDSGNAIAKIKPILWVDGLTGEHISFSYRAIFYSNYRSIGEVDYGSNYRLRDILEIVVDECDSFLLEEVTL